MDGHIDTSSHHHHTTHFVTDFGELAEIQMIEMCKWCLYTCVETVDHLVKMSDCVQGISHVNAKGKGINSKGWVGNQVFRRLDQEKREKSQKSEISERDLQKAFWEIQNHKFPLDD